MVCKSYNKWHFEQGWKFRKIEDYPPEKRPVFYENIAIENALSDFMTSCQNLCGKTHEGCLRVIETKIENMNAYGRMIHRKARECSNFYMLLSFEDRKYGWDSACRSMEWDLTDFDPNYIFDRDKFFSTVQKIINLNYFNRIEQFMIRLFRNSLFLGNKTKNMQKDAFVNCFAELHLIK